jgi:[CysO sulfur-carrier protein]-S-L-cysteine hydrolase
MKLLLPLAIVERLRRELRGRSREIGGVLVGEHVEAETFRLVDLSVQISGGTTAHFIRDHVQAQAFLDEFFRRTGQNYQRYNYIGEWHSHPRFMPLPSAEDRDSMEDLISDPETGVAFLVLIIARAGYWSGIQLSATLFRQGFRPAPVDVSIEGVDARQRRTMVEWVCDWFRLT